MENNLLAMHEIREVVSKRITK